MNQDVKALEEALAKGPTAGEWFSIGADPWSAGGSHVQWGCFHISAGSDDFWADNYYRIGAVSNSNDSSENEANADFIIAAHPDRIRRLLGYISAVEQRADTAEARLERAMEILRDVDVNELSQSMEDCIAAFLGEGK